MAETVTIADIVVAAQEVCGEVAGPGVQTYDEDRMTNDAIRIFNLLFKKRVWEQYTEWSQHTLDGTLGIVNANAFTFVRDFEDFISVHRENENKPIGALPKRMNPFTMTGTKVLAWTSLPSTHTSFATRRLQFWPKASIGIVQVQTRVYPVTGAADDLFNDTTTILLDKDLMVYGTAWLTFVGDDLNANAAQVCQALMDGRYNDIVTQLSSKPVDLSPGSGIPNDWFYTTPN